MAEIVNLRQARKRRGRAEKSAEADANRARHGRPKAERGLDAARKAQDDARLEGHRIDAPEDEPA